MAHWVDEEDIDLHIRHALPPRRHDFHTLSPVVLPEHRHRALARPPYNHVQSGYLFAEQPVASGLQRSRSQGHRAAVPPTPPLIIQNRIDNHFEGEVFEDEDRFHMRTPVLYSPERAPHSRSHSRHDGRPSSSSYSRDAWELERVRKELEGYKLEEQREQEERRIKHELELKRLREEKKAEEEKMRLRLEQEKTIKEFKQKEAERIAREKKEKEEREKEYKQRLEEDLRTAGLDEGRIAVVLNKDKAGQPASGRPTYTRMSRRHLSIETLNKYRIDYELDQNPDYVLIKRWVPEWEQDFLWNHTRELRERKILLLESPHHSRGRERQVEYDIIRTREHKRRNSPSTLLTFFAGGR